MALLAVSYPHISAAHYTWIQDIRQHYDSHYTLIDPHVTLVFPQRTLSQSAFVSHIQLHCATIRPISFVFRCAIIVKDSFGPATHVFLVPDEGFSALVKVHDALYTGPLAPALRVDVAYIPHITIADFADASDAKALADRINRQERSLEGCIDAIDILSYEHPSIVPITRIALV